MRALPCLISKCGHSGKGRRPHIGNAANKILKDFIVKYQSLRGKDAPYVPGWDCHGLPIEFKVTQEMRKAGNTTADPASIRTACDAYALAGRGPLRPSSGQITPSGPTSYFVIIDGP